MRSQREGARHCASRIERRHQLADAEDQDISVEDRRPPPHRGRHRHGDIIMSIVQNPAVRPRRQRKQRMLQRGQIMLRVRVKKIADKEISPPNTGAAPVVICLPTVPFI